MLVNTNNEKRAETVLQLQLGAWSFESHNWDEMKAGGICKCKWCGLEHKIPKSGILGGCPLCTENPLIKEMLS